MVSLDTKKSSVFSRLIKTLRLCQILMGVSIVNPWALTHAFFACLTFALMLNGWATSLGANPCDAPTRHPARNIQGP
jgi:hypothetical protein